MYFVIYFYFVGNYFLRISHKDREPEFKVPGNIVYHISILWTLGPDLKGCDCLCVADRGYVIWLCDCHANLWKFKL